MIYTVALLKGLGSMVEQVEAQRIAYYRALWQFTGWIASGDYDNAKEHLEEIAGEYEAGISLNSDLIDS